MSPALALVLAAALGSEARVEAGIRIEGRGRHLDPPPTPAERDVVDVSATPRLNLTWTGAPGSLSASYEPRVTASDVGPDLRWERMQEGSLRLRLGRGPTWTFEGFAEGAVGRTDLITENRTAGAGAGSGTGAGRGTSTISTVSTLDMERQRAGFTLQLAPERRTELVLSGTASQDGGTDDASRALLPVARALEAGAQLRWNATRRDQVGIRLAAARGRIASIDTDSAWASALATWRRRLTPEVEVWGGAGAVALQSRVPGPAGEGLTASRETHEEVDPAGELGISRSARAPEPTPQGTTPSRTPLLPLDLTGQAVATLGASVDRLTGLSTPELDIRAELRWPLAPSVAIVGRGTGSVAWPDTGRAWRGQLELGASFQLAERVLVDLGGYGSWQNSSDPALLDYTEYGVFLRLSADAPPLSF